MSRGIFLIGPMAAGKSAVGRQLAAQLGVPFIDTDAEVESAHGPIPAIFASLGEAGFRAFESEALATAVAAAEERDAVVATGGGAVLDGANRRLLASRFTVYLETDLDTVRPRIAAASGRPLLAGDAIDRWVRLLAAREDHYRSCAALTVDARRGTPAELAAGIRAARAALQDNHEGSQA